MKLNKAMKLLLLTLAKKVYNNGDNGHGPRQNFAQLIPDIRQKNGGMIGLTVMFPEADLSRGDEVLASWIKGNGVILSQTPSTRGVRSSGPTLAQGRLDPTHRIIKLAPISNPTFHT